MQPRKILAEAPAVRELGQWIGASLGGESLVASTKVGELLGDGAAPVAELRIVDSYMATSLPFPLVQCRIRLADRLRDGAPNSSQPGGCGDPHLRSGDLLRLCDPREDAIEDESLTDRGSGKQQSEFLAAVARAVAVLPASASAIRRPVVASTWSPA